MKKRLRKKLRRGEFQEFGFALRFSFRSTLLESKWDAFFDDFIGEAIEANNLLFGGGCGYSEWDGFVTHGGKRGSVGEEERQKVLAWLASRQEVAEYEAGPLVDAWHGH